MELQNSIIKLWEKYGASFISMGHRIIIALLIVIGGNIVIRLSRRLTHRAVTGKLHADETFASILRVVIQYGVVIVCLIMILDIFGVNTAGLIAILGAAGVAIGFALRDTLGNIAAGIVLLILRPFCKGDYIECGSIAGSVQEQGLFSTIMKTSDGIFISAPNSSLWGVPLKNYSRNPQRRMDISLTISYTDSIDAAFQVFRDIITQESRFLTNPPAQVLVQSLGEIGIGITLRAWVQGNVYWLVYWDQMKNVKEKIQEAGLSIALPRREIHMVQDKTMQSYGAENSKEL